MSIVNNLIEVSKLKGVERQEYLKKYFKKVSKEDILFLSFIMSTKIQKLKTHKCSYTPIYKGKEHFMYLYLVTNKIYPQYLTLNEILAINILKGDSLIPHIELLLHLPYVFSQESLIKELKNIIITTNITIKGVSEFESLYLAYISNKGSLLLSNKSTPPPIALKPLECILYTKEQKVIAQGSISLYSWFNNLKNILPPCVLKLHGKHIRQYKGRYNFILTHNSIIAEYIKLDVIECKVIDWIIDNQTFLPLGVKFKVPSNLKIKSNEIYFEDKDILNELTNYKILAYYNDRNIIKQVKLIKRRNIE